METIVLSPVGTDLASRKSGAILRSDIETLLCAHEKVTIDLSNVITISDSYADELFGILARTLGIEEFSKKVNLHRPSIHILQRIAIAIKGRFESDDLQHKLKALVIAAKNNDAYGSGVAR